MKIIDLLNKIANGEEVPKKIKYKGSIYTYLEQEGHKIYQYEDYNAVLDIQCFEKLNDEVEILEEEKEIQELKAKLEMYENGVYFSSENDELQQRIDKAIEHLKEVMKDEEEYEEDYIYNNYLLDILQGVDKE